MILSIFKKLNTMATKKLDVYFTDQEDAVDKIIDASLKWNVDQPHWSWAETLGFKQIEDGFVYAEPVNGRVVYGIGKTQFRAKFQFDKKCRKIEAVAV